MIAHRYPRTLTQTPLVELAYEAAGRDRDTAEFGLWD